MNKTTYMSIALVAVVLGLMMAFQFRTTSSIDRAVPYDRVQELTIEKKQAERDLINLQEEVADLTAKLAEASQGQHGATGALASELFKNKLYAGLIPVEGPGLEVTLQNSPETERPGVSFAYNNIKDDDLLKVINDLRGAGAEAIAVNDQRILATSEVRLAGNHINVNLTRLSPPYKVLAIGSPGALKSSLEIRGGLIEYLGDLGILVTVETRDNIKVPGYTGGLRFEYARPVQK